MRGTPADPQALLWTFKKATKNYAGNDEYPAEQAEAVAKVEREPERAAVRRGGLRLYRLQGTREDARAGGLGAAWDEGERGSRSEPVRPVQPVRATVAMPVAGRHHLAAPVRHNDVVGNNVPESLRAAEERLEQLSEQTVKEAEAWDWPARDGRSSSGI